MRSLPRPVLPALVALLVAAAALFWFVGRDDPEAAPVDGSRPQLADRAGDYRPGSVPESLDEAVEVAVAALPLALGYDYRTLGKGLDRATALMTEDFGEEFRRTFRSSAGELARTQRAVTTAGVRAAGVVRVEDGRVLCLVYVDQLLVSSTTVQDRDAPVRVSQNRVLVGLTEEDGVWRVDAIEPL